jgi:subtilisin family serine protease
VPFPTRRLGSAAVAVVVAATLLVGILPAAGSPVRAANPVSTGDAVQASADGAAPGGRLIVFWKADHRPNLSLPLVASARSSSTGSRRSVVTAAPGQTAKLAAALRANPDVAAVVPDVILSATDWPTSGDPNDTYYASNQADLPRIGMPAAWSTTTGSSSVVVAILDTGTTMGHEDLLGTTFVAPLDEINGTPNAADDEGHGTHVTGTIAAQADNAKGIAGMAPGVSIMPIKVLNSDGNGDLDGILDGIDYAVAHDADVINMSLGGVMDPATVAAAQPTIDAAYAAGITMVAAAGNNFDGTVEYPCAFVHVICVGATDNLDGHAPFSNVNSYVDISAPGVGVVSTVPGGYAPLSGTSMSTPHVAALAALIRSANPGETVDQVEATILSTAIDLGAPCRDDGFGFGRIDAAAAVNLAPPVVSVPLMTSLTAPSIVRSANRAFTATWTATDNASGICYEVRTKKSGTTGRWSAITSQPETTLAFNGLSAGTWYVAVRAVDTGGLRSAWRQVAVIIPKDDRAWSFTSGTNRRTGSAYINGTDTTTSRSGARMTVRFTGSAFYLFGTSAVKRGKLRVTIDGRSWIVDEGRYRGVRATRTTYRVLVFAKALTRRSHTVVITCLATSGRPVIDVDAVAWRN